MNDTDMPNDQIASVPREQSVDYVPPDLDSILQVALDDILNTYLGVLR
jgi:hypothetical protein